MAIVTGDTPPHLRGRRPGGAAPRRTAAGAHSWLFAVTVAVLSLAIASCAAADDPPGQPARADAPNATEILPTQSPADATAPAGAGPRIVDLADLGDPVEAALAGLEDGWAFAVLLPDRATLYGLDPYRPFPMASVAKIPIALAFLDAVYKGGREPTDEELRLLGAMITQSDNDAADVLFSAVGAGPGVEAFFERYDIRGISFVPGSLAWGDGTASAAGLAGLLALVYREDALDAGARRIFLTLVSSVNAEQRWGASAAFEGEESHFGIKNGWFPDADGWRVASAGLNTDPAAEPLVVVALASSRPSLPDAIATIEAVARAAGAAVAGLGPPPGIPPPAFVTTRTVYAPTPRGLPLREGVCSPSALVARDGAYACDTGGARHEFCFAGPTGSEDLVSCDALPGKPRGAAFAVLVPGIERPGGLDALAGRGIQPWFMELDDGTSCERPRSPVEDIAPAGEELTAVCEDGRVVLGTPSAGTVSWVRTYDARLGLAFEVRARSLWY